MSNIIYNESKYTTINSFEERIAPLEHMVKDIFEAEKLICKEDENKSCDNCKHHLKFMCKNWETCHDYSDWELEELDFVQPKRSIPCTIKINTNSEYINKQQVMSDYADWYGYDYQNNWFYKHLKNMSSVNIPNKVGHWIWQTEDIYQCSECGENLHVKKVMNKPQYAWCPICGHPMKIER